MEGRGTYTYAHGDRYVGEFSANQREGYGAYFYKHDGARYVGSWAAGKKEGAGTSCLANGDVYVGEWCEGLMDGRGAYLYADGRLEVGNYESGCDVGEAAQWSIDRQMAWQVHDGQRGAPISLEHAEAIAMQLGFAMPLATLEQILNEHRDRIRGLTTDEAPRPSSGAPTGLFVSPIHASPDRTRRL